MGESRLRQRKQTERGEVCTHERLSFVNKILCGKPEKLNSFNVLTGCVLAGILLEKGDELNLILTKFAR